MEQQVPSMAIILLSEDIEKVHAGALVGSMAAMSGMEVNLFVTMNALKPFLKKSVENKDFKTGDVGKALIEKDAPSFDKLIREGREMGTLNVYGCALALDVMEWNKDDLIDVFDDIIGVTKFLGMAQNGQVVTM
ncbi:DsrE/DsrF/DrsH-like family protein [Bacillus marinisedimentorum]|uniref:DsrE/DsrF/DrsH-like family protein n=1 Tax=Bacillus marinisedimentorum TaxID=1821260 RepID=UPI0012FF9FF3|nr:DsrE/DsrF/DrsH-like family protein [Bacillus marinisedimentorum]